MVGNAKARRTHSPRRFRGHPAYWYAKAVGGTFRAGKGVGNKTTCGLRGIAASRAHRLKSDGSRKMQPMSPAQSIHESHLWRTSSMAKVVDIKTKASTPSLSKLCRPATGGPFIVIDLKTVSRMARVEIVNRKDLLSGSNQDAKHLRFQALAGWSRGNRFGRRTRGKQEYDFDVPAIPFARFGVKLELRERTELHLFSVKIYGSQ